MEHKSWNIRCKTKSESRSSATCSMLRVPSRRGFTIVELIVTIAIFLIITSITMVSQRRFGGNLLITNLAYDVALSIRQAQVYGISVRRATQVALPSEQFNKSYGIHFALTGGFVLFTDLDANGLYDTRASGVNGCFPYNAFTNPNPECVSVFRIEQGNSITKFCGGDDNCTDSTDINKKIDGLDILFHRPDPEPIIRASKSGVVKGPYADASVTVTSPQGVNKTVTVSASGQISIQ